MLTTQNQLHVLVNQHHYWMLLSVKFSQQMHHGYTKLQKIFIVSHLMILICYSKRCSLTVELLSDSLFVDKKLFYVIRDEVHYLAKEICNDVWKSTFETFTLMFGETITKQNKKQMEMLRYFSKTANLVETRCLFFSFLQVLQQILLLKNFRICKMTKSTIYHRTGYSSYL